MMKIINGVRIYFNWNQKVSENLAIEGDTLVGGNVKASVVKNAIFDSDNTPFYYDPKSQIYSAFIGYIVNSKRVISRHCLKQNGYSHIVGELYKKIGLEGLWELDGLFMIILFDTIKKRCYILQSQWGYSLPIYYSLHTQSFRLSTSLKDLLAESNSSRELNESAVLDFLYFQYMIPNESTLVRGISKLVPKKYLDIDYAKNDVILRDVPKHSTDSRFSQHHAKQSLIDSIDDVIRNIVHESKTSHMAQTITAGWDCNLILHFLSKAVPISLVAAVIKGGKKKDEVQASQKIIKNNYSNVQHVSGEVTADHMELLPEIVWHYEGYLYQEGIYLRYELAKILQKTRSLLIFLGAGADQVLFPETRFKNFLRKTRNFFDPYWAFRRSFEKSSPNRDYAMLIDYNIKMHDIILNDYGMQGVYPFVNNQTSDISRSLRIWHKWKKRYYKKKVRTLLKPTILQFIAKSGAVVDTITLFRSHQPILLPFLDSEFIRRFLSKKQFQRIQMNPDKYHLIIIHLVYLYLFNEIFISGRFDYKFKQRNLGLRLKDFVSSGILKQSA